MSITDWPRRQRYLFVVLAFVTMGAGVWWAVAGGTAMRFVGVLALCVSMPMVGYGCRAVSIVDTGPLRGFERRYMRQFTPAMMLYMLLMLLVWPHAPNIANTWLKALVALSPLVPVAWLIVAMVRLVLDSDELEQRIHLQSLAVAAGAVAIISMGLGFLVAARVMTLGGSVLLWVFPALVFIYGGVRMWLTLRLRGE